MTDLVLANVRLATMQRGAAPYGESPFDAIAFRAGRIAWMGHSREAPFAAVSLDGRGRWATPGLIDCHTHLVYGGNRAREFEMRLAGKTYEEIARAGGGIRATVKATREASEDDLVAHALPRLRSLAAEGVTVVEIKSGYGLDLESELRILRAARRLGTRVPVTVRTTLLALHALPGEYAGRADDYVELACKVMVPEAAAQGLADAVDAFCESIAFDARQVERIFQAAREHKLPVKLHAEQLSNQHGAQLAARYGALSADHLEHLDEAGARAMAAAGTVAVLLPGAFVFLGEKQRPPIDALRRLGVPIALATDHNPGTSPYSSLLLMLNLACAAFRLTPEEALAGVTREGARALGMHETHGTLALGKAADVVLWDIEHPSELAYSYGTHRPSAVYRAGVEVSRP
ncbi:MAG TPA: imidazolonepropionase [Usitatibacter sp.]|jgi:imidazolonepropionase|nr:imidazolonepropionase [Usitatibacter sp.]